jgi:hypothetical protein
LITEFTDHGSGRVAPSAASVGIAGIDRAALDTFAKRVARDEVPYFMKRDTPVLTL